MDVVTQVSKDEELLATATDCFHFVVTYFEPISVSAVHIYHSALECSPISSTVRQLYYHQRCTPFPYVVTGTPGTWNQSINISCLGSNLKSFTWSQCGQFIAAMYPGEVEIRDSHSSELLSTLRPTEPTSHLINMLAYSPDGHTLAAFLTTSLVIWDIQTGGVVKEVECGLTNNAFMVWSLDGQAIGITLSDGALTCRYTIHLYDVDSGVTQSPGTVQSNKIPHLWAHGKSFRIMTHRWDGQGCTINISEVGSVLTRIESFHIGLFRQHDHILSFSPTTYRISASLQNELCILNIQTSEPLLKEQDRLFRSHCFSSDGSLFAASVRLSVCIWKYDSGQYTQWMEFPNQRYFPRCLQFSPALSSIAGCLPGVIQVWHLDHPPVNTHPNNCMPLLALPHHCTYMATSHHRGDVVTITNLLLQTTSQVIDTSMEIKRLVLTNNVLLVLGNGTIIAWQLTEEGVVDGIFGNRRAGCSDSVWAVPLPLFNYTTISPYSDPTFFVEDQVVAIRWQGLVVCVYNMRTGELLRPAQAPSHHHTLGYSLWDLLYIPHYLHCHESNIHIIHSENDWQVSRTTLQEGWVKDPEGRHRLWVPIQWRVSIISVGWLSKIMALRLNLQGGSIVIKF